MDLEVKDVNGSNCLSRNESDRGLSASSSGVSTALASVLIFTIVVDILGNVLVILSVYRNKKLRNAGNIFVVSLSVADLVVALYPYPLVLTAIFHNDWTMGDLHCQASGFIMGLSVIGSIFNITAIAINRYCYICHSLHYDRLYSLRNTCCYLGLTWLLTAIATVPNFFVGSLQYDPRIYSCTFAQTVSSYYTISVVVIHFLIPLLVVSYCYMRIWVLVIQVKHRVKPEQRTKLKPSDVRNFLTMFMVFVLFAVCWAPLNLIGLAVAINPVKVAPNIPEWLFVTSYFMAYFNSCLNAIIYGLLNQNFRKEYKTILLALCIPRLLLMETSSNESSLVSALKTLLFFTILMVTLPIGLYFASKAYIFEGSMKMSSSDSYFYAAIVAVLAVHVVLALFVYVAWNEGAPKGKGKDD
ncbi:Melatonin receptor type 1C [Collichthys lucidus]|uniref:Melatonin receptor type 1C n=1 Tax=Collichthys lucidus TaxID=240159 RepID=A0A4U5UEQ4_COLLU|nr:Melatonin receptor type 1C [Collichthys lucidus]